MRPLSIKSPLATPPAALTTKMTQRILARDDRRLVAAVVEGVAIVEPMLVVSRRDEVQVHRLADKVDAVERQLQVHTLQARQQVLDRRELARVAEAVL